MTPRSGWVDITSPKDIARHIYQAVGPALYPTSDGCGNYTVRAGVALLTIGPDQQYADGICWALCTSEDLDGDRYGGWGFGDRETAEREISQLVRDLTEYSRRPFCPTCEQNETVVLTYLFEGVQRVELNCGHDYPAAGAVQ